MGLPARTPVRDVRPPPGRRACPRPPAPAACGHCAQENRLTQAGFHCQRCAHTAHADVNAAINILRAGLALRDAAQAA
ncbi:zinc ribbon domain-containing protein [Streptosporangium sp. OZ121]|uniref:zinc ribbon domain-containing protein n=1 Tax=Streptosporangium sp. OZ121 TaxID=3444183 RepID=UPI003F794BEF